MTIACIVWVVCGTPMTNLRAICHPWQWNFYLATYSFLNNHNLLYMVISFFYSYIKIYYYIHYKIVDFHVVLSNMFSAGSPSHVPCSVLSSLPSHHLNLPIIPPTPSYQKCTKYNRLYILSLNYRLSNWFLEVITTNDKNSLHWADKDEELLNWAFWLSEFLLRSQV